MAEGTTQPIKEFELLRQRARQRARQSGQEAVGAIQRRFAALGGVSGGAAIKQESLARARAQGVGEESVQNLDLAEAQEQQRRTEIAEGRSFQAGESLKGRQFAAEQAGLGRQFTSGQAGLQRGFAAEQARLGRSFSAEQAGIQRSFLDSQGHKTREFQSLENTLGRDATSALQQKQLDFQSQEAVLGRDLARELQQLSQEFSGIQSSRAQNAAARLQRAAAAAAYSRQISGQEAAAALQQASIAANKIALGDTQEFQAKQSELQRDFVADESSQDREQRNTLATSQLNQAAQSLKLEEDAQSFNKEMAKWQQGQPTDLFAQLLGPEYSLSNFTSADGSSSTINSPSGGFVDRITSIFD